MLIGAAMITIVPIGAAMVTTVVTSTLDFPNCVVINMEGGVVEELGKVVKVKRRREGEKGGTV